MSVFKKIIQGMIVFITIFGNVALSAQEKNIQQGLDLYSSFKNAQEILSAMAMNASVSDQKFLQNLQSQLGSEALPKVKLQGKNLFIAGLKKPIQIVNINKGHFTSEGQDLYISVDKSAEKNLIELQKALSSQVYSLNPDQFSPRNSNPGIFDLFFPKAHAFVQIIALPVVAAYTVMAGTTAAACAVMGNELNLPANQKKKMALDQCPEVAIKWPFYGYKAFDQMALSSEVISGKCLKDKNNQTQIQLVTKNTKNNFTVGLADLENKKDLPWQLGTNPEKAKKYILSLVQMCQRGDSALLNENIKKYDSIQRGLVQLQKDKSSPNSTTNKTEKSTN